MYVTIQHSGGNLYYVLKEYIPKRGTVYVGSLGRTTDIDHHKAEYLAEKATQKLGWSVSTEDIERVEGVQVFRSRDSRTGEITSEEPQKERVTLYLPKDVIAMIKRLDAELYERNGERMSQSKLYTAIIRTALNEADLDDLEEATLQEKARSYIYRK